jgi:F0F1-type ATP synthase delta subunit
MLQLDLSDFFTTKPQAVDFSNRLAVVLEHIYATGFNLESVLLAQFGIEKKDKFMTLLRDQEIDSNSNSALQNFLGLLQDVISKLPVATLTLAFEPTDTVLHNLSEWFTLNANRQVLFDIKIDPTLIAGAAITYNGKYFDFSVKSRFEQVLTETLATL